MSLGSRIWTLRSRMAIVFAVTLGCTALVLVGFDVEVAYQLLREVDPVAIVVVLVLYSIVLALRTVRFMLLVSHPVGLCAMASVTTVGFMAISVMPLRLGEAVRPYLLVDRHGVPVGTALAAVVAERLLDLGALLAMFGVAAFVVQFPSDQLVIGGVDVLLAGQRVAGMGVVIGGLALGLLAWRGERAVQAVSVYMGPRKSVALTAVRTFVEAVRALAHPVRGIGAVGVTVVMWVLTTAAFGAMAHGFEGVTLQPQEMLVGWTATIAVSLLIPTPGAIGAFEVGGMVGLVAVGLNEDLARVVMMALHAVTLGHAVAAGLMFSVFEGWSLREVMNQAGSSAVASRREPV